MIRYEWGAVSDCGDVRSENQDRVLCLTGDINGIPVALFAVADGMGGLSYGSHASHYVVSQLQSWWYEDFFEMAALGKNSMEDIGDIFDQALWDINQSLRHAAIQSKCRWGSTLSLLLLRGDRYCIRNIGDSRIYLQRAGGLSQMTEDQSFVAALVRQGKMTEEEAEQSPNRNVLTMCVGMFEQLEVFRAEGRAKEGDFFLLCSDGFYHLLTPSAISHRLKEFVGAVPQAMAQYLRGEIPFGKASDNVSLVIVEVCGE